MLNNESKQRRFRHSPTTTVINGVKLDITEDGKITMTQINKEGNEEVEDIISTTAAFIVQAHEVLKSTRKSYFVNRDTKS